MRGPLILTLTLTLACTGGDKGDGSDTGSAAPGAQDGDGDGVPASEDCDDADPSVSPLAEEVCDDVDNDCDGEVDEGVTATFWTDGDGDGYGDAGAPVEACEAPDGAVDNDGDCDDADERAWPGAAEVCDGLDNDCDGDTDEELLGTWYVDGDGDGWGDPALPEMACEQPDGTVDDATDCNDSDSAVHPAATEVCDEVDNNCDGTVDEGVETTFWADVNGDGWGDEGATVEACSVPLGYALVPGDCDDLDPLAAPDLLEECDGWDNDCDGDIDEPDAIDAGTFYTDADGDGYGDPSAATVSCSWPSGTEPVAGDCDDGDAAISPAATEVCDSVDNDCDALVDDDDGDLDLSSATTWYDDGDGDGYGDAATATTTCVQPSGAVTDDQDCDDGDGAISPAATEICDSVDNDCDGDVDDDDASLDLATATTWYADADGDGEGDPSVSYDTCVQPSGTVTNDTDCDDADANDLDGDGTQDCADDDRDGDGLRNDWDADPDDDTVARPPNDGLGTDGSYTVSGAETWSEWTLLSSGAVAGDASLVVDDASAFAAGDEALVWSQQGADAGTWQSVMVDAVSGTTLTIEPPLDDDYSASSIVLVQRVPHFTDLTVPSGATLTADAWAGGGGGLVIARATGSVTVAGAIDADALGFEGGRRVLGNGSNPTQGESWPGTGAAGDTSANGGGGGAYPRRGDNGDSGAGGGYGSAGTAGTSYSGASVTTGGSAHGDADLSTLFLGSGGGGGSPDTEGDGSSTSNRTGAGGAGGGAVLLFAGVSLDVSGTITADGAAGGTATSAGGEVGGGGGGSGGAIWLAGDSVSITGTVSATGGARGSSAWHSGTPYGSAYGGVGGDGRVRLDSVTLSGSTSPTAGHTAAWTE